jgi:hypothetical protein
MTEPAMFASGTDVPRRGRREHPRLDSCITHQETCFAFRLNVRAASFAAHCGPHRATRGRGTGASTRRRRIARCNGEIRFRRRFGWITGGGDAEALRPRRPEGIAYLFL